MPVGRVPAAMASAMAGFSPASRARRRCAWNSYWAVHLRPAMMIASSLSRGGIELPNRTNAPTRWTRSHSSGLRRSALNGPRRPAPRGPDWMASATRFCSVVIVSAVSVVNRPSLIAMPPLRGRPWPPARVDCSGRRERHRQPLDAADEVRAALLRLRRGLEVGQPLPLLVGELREGPHALADGRARGLVAGGDEQEEERPEVLWGHRLAVDLGVHEHGREVVLRMLEPLLSQPEPVLAQLARRLQEGLARAPERLVAAGQEAIGQVQQLRPVALRHAHHVVAQPEVEAGRIDLVERQGGRRRGNGAHTGPLCRVGVEASVVYRIGYTLSRHTRRRTACE